jgi:hypothetical protein
MMSYLHYLAKEIHVYKCCSDVSNSKNISRDLSRCGKIIYKVQQSNKSDYAESKKSG